MILSEFNCTKNPRFAFIFLIKNQKDYVNLHQKSIS